ncbi:hypothetical protein CASFOL_035872 [Castilleja foliolosa]|uniref:RING-type E3 ubiquitin transferase n=1 Tax=Castilleja foliolosa TaxID=1961234 RepID=A0ABD3BU31_9LAMI
MAFHHRMLNPINESFSDPVLDQFCEEYCNNKKPDAICLYKCIYFCSDLCNIPPPPPEKSPGLSLSLTISLSALAAVFFLLTCYTIYKLCSNLRGSRRRRRSQRQEDGGSEEFIDEEQGPVVDHHVWYIRTIGLQPSIIGAITIVKFKKGDGLIDGTSCSVCLSEFEEDETLRLMPKCNHAFHMSCIDTWLRSHTNCPICRAGIVSTSARLSSSSLEQNVRSSGLNPEDEARTRISGSNTNSELGRDLGNDSTELSIGFEDDTVSRAHTGPKVLEPLRRSISVDCLLSSAFPRQCDRNIDHQLVEVKESTTSGVGVGYNQGLLRLIGSPWIERSLQTGSSAIKRSLSCSANVFLSRHSSRNRI